MRLNNNKQRKVMDIKRRQALTHVMANVRLRREYKKMRKVKVKGIALLFAASLLATGCTAKGRISDSSGYVNLEADEAGMLAFSSLIQGAISNGKASPDQDTTHYQTQRHYEAERTKRAVDPGLLEAIFAGGK
jgi:hypothetical protein